MRPEINRRKFLQAAALAPGAAGGKTVSIVSDPADAVAAGGPAQWAIQELEDTLRAVGLRTYRYDSVAEAPPQRPCILAASDISLGPEALRIAPAIRDGRNVLRAAGGDSRGQVYAILELADRAANSNSATSVLTSTTVTEERPANTVRGIARLFTSDVEDKPWYNDREMWPRYFTQLAAQRFNRFHLAFGIGYDFLTNVTDAYFLFPYPFLLAVPGYSVRVPQLPDRERDANFTMLRYISGQAAARGLHFQLGLWTHGYRWIDSPHPNYTIEGLTQETHGPYCRDALRALLQGCPAIGGITFRVHGESGVEEGSYGFWKTVFEGVATCGRRVEIDLHAKGMTPEMLEIGAASGMPLRVSPKYWAEHMGLPYMQASIREQEMPKAGARPGSLMKFSAGSRSFLRYSYGDLLREDRRWSVMTRVWPGTQRLLLWGDPVTAAAHAEAFRFCGCDGVELCEPLSFKGRRGSGIAGGRCGYADAALEPRWDWEKYAYYYRIWGRLTYNPQAPAESWRRYLRKHFGTAAGELEEALANASRILPIVTTAYCPSAANNNYWPEMYTNQSLADAGHFAPYGDTAPPRVFGNASPLDPQLFASPKEFADELLSAARSGRYSPLETAQWIEDYASAAARNLEAADARAGRKNAEYRRAAIDIRIQAGLGRFFGAKFRAAVLYRIFERSGDRAALEHALSQYRRAQTAWAEFAGEAKDAYASDITVGEHPWLRGHWLDRLPAIEADIRLIAKQAGSTGQGVPEEHVRRAILEALGRPHRTRIACRHDPPPRFYTRRPLAIAITAAADLESVRLFYRHVNQAERYDAAAMAGHGGRYEATISATYTNSPFPIQYYFELRENPESVDLFPGFAAELSNRPYFVVRRG